MSLKLEIEGQANPIESFALPEMSLSSARTSMTPWNYSIYLNEEEIIELLSDDYQQLISDLKEDDEQMGSPQDELGEAGYPQLDQVLKDSKLLESAIGHYLFENLVAKFSLGSPQTKYWHDEISSCKNEAGLVKIYGICYSK